MTYQHRILTKSFTGKGGDTMLIDLSYYPTDIINIVEVHAHVVAGGVVGEDIFYQCDTFLRGIIMDLLSIEIPRLHAKLQEENIL